MHEAVKRFESELRRVVRRGSRSEEFENPVVEMVGHFSDLYEEELALGANQDRAEKRARTRLGSMGQIALQILNSSSRQTRGMRIQKALFWIPAAFAVLYIATAFTSDRNIGQYLWMIVNPFLILACISGLVYGYGIVLARKFAWKPVLVASLLSMSALFYVYSDGQKQNDAKMAENKKQLDQYLALRPQLDKDRQAVNLLRQRHKPFVQQYGLAAGQLENSKSGAFLVDANSKGKYLSPEGVVWASQGYQKAQLKLSRTDDMNRAQRKWLSVGSSFYNDVLENFEGNRLQSGWTQAYLSWSFFDLCFMSLMSTGTFLAFYFAFALIGGLATRIWILRTEWFRLVKSS